MLRFAFFSIVLTVVTGVFPITRELYVIDRIYPDVAVLEPVSFDPRAERSSLDIQKNAFSYTIEEGDVIELVRSDFFVLQTRRRNHERQQREEEVVNLLKQLAKSPLSSTD